MNLYPHAVVAGNMLRTTPTGSRPPTSRMPPCSAQGRKRFEEVCCRRSQRVAQQGGARKYDMDVETIGQYALRHCSALGCIALHRAVSLHVMGQDQGLRHCRCKTM